MHRKINQSRFAVSDKPRFRNMTNDTLTGETLDALYLEWKATKAGLESLETQRREHQAKLDELLDAVREQWQADNAEFWQLWDQQVALAAETETALRDAVIAAYEANGRTNKQIAPGCSVRINTKLDYNAATALDFAKTHGICLKLDAKEFEKVAPTICPNLVTPIETVTAVLSSK